MSSGKKILLGVAVVLALVSVGEVLSSKEPTLHGKNVTAHIDEVETVDDLTKVSSIAMKLADTSPFDAAMCRAILKGKPSSSRSAFLVVTVTLTNASDAPIQYSDPERELDGLYVTYEGKRFELDERNTLRLNMVQTGGPFKNLTLDPGTSMTLHAAYDINDRYIPTVEVGFR